MSIKAIAVDAAFANMGLARISLSFNGDWQVSCDDLRLISTSREDHKEVRKSSDDLRRAVILFQALKDWSNGAQIAFAEVPSGSQSAAAARALGIAVGVLGGCPLPIIEVNPMEVKRLFGPGRKGAPKAQIIEWAVNRWPKAPWLRNKGRLIQANEHLADAMAVVVAGLRTPAFIQLTSLQKHATTSPSDQRLAPRRVKLR